jgi:hypothetical protein
LISLLHWWDDSFEEAVPPFESLSPAKMLVEHRAGANSHMRNTIRVGREAEERIAESLSATRLDNDSALMPPDEACDFAILRSDRDHWAARSSDAIELARNDEAFELGLERDPVQICHAQGVFER